MALIVSFLISSGSKKQEPRCACLSDAKASHSHEMWTEVSSSLPHLAYCTTLHFKTAAVQSNHACCSNQQYFSSHVTCCLMPTRTLLDPFQSSRMHMSDRWPIILRLHVVCLSSVMRVLAECFSQITVASFHILSYL
jgi:hypothetical protein